MPSALLAAALALQVPPPPSASAAVWQAPAGCPDRDALATAIARRLGRDPGPDELALDGRVERSGATHFRLDLRLTVAGHTQARRLGARRCDALVDAAALLAALALDPTVAARGEPVDLEAPEAGELAPDPVPGDAAIDPAPDLAPRPEASLEPPAPAPSPPPPDPAVTAEAPLAPPSPPRRRGPGMLLRLAGGLEVGTLPAPTATVDLALGVLWRRARLEFHGLHLVPQTESRPPHAVRVYLLGGGVRGCARLFRGDFEFPLCGGLELGGLRGEGRGPGARAATGLWAAALVSAGATWRFHPRLGLLLAAQGLVRLTSPRFDLADPVEPVGLFNSAPVSLRLLLGLELHLGDPR
ncbi:hypothetical protein [Nannocystis bainbridge]|uniref:Uncharacterized protein n=1 Tax=Nannocystis bainbridge TaxID=2995303 RepID=A0ABT5EA62_9BACT|nr:hypothetical protein [Nannocystis bainbridge]MDC0722742.1 hypothetical protein [Nannocystis bainbridge]